MTARETLKRKRDSSINGDLLLPPSKRHRAEPGSHLLDLPTELLDHIVEHCDQDAMHRLACTCTVLHHTVARYRGFSLSVNLPPGMEHLFDRSIMSNIHPFAKQLRARPWWTPRIVTIQVSDELPRASPEDKEKWDCYYEFAKSDPTEILDHLWEDIALIAERSGEVYLTARLSGCGHNVIRSIRRLLAICTSVAISCRKNGRSDSMLTTEDACDLAQCAHVTLVDCLFDEPEPAYHAFQECSHLVLCNTSSVSDDIIEFLLKHKVAVIEI